ncbi:calcium-binding protein [Crenothrix polyspora]|uniref:Peptidase metallopeptidase domain-containing protein n=1 Tax=Crenothrix polyspora TaxID=360316 RepID=A0A1R4H6P9_9GAMM|nr:calcium-binding protein [Crenothrix polyspora]SJM91914.1 hypothetical protein CRENPOLYSF1_220057 [Crenothrix polyspora]
MASTQKIHGSSDNNTLTGSSRSEEIYGLAGNDSLNGNAGNDILFGGEGADTYIFEKNTGKDIIENYDKDHSIDTVRFSQLLPSAITHALRDVAKGSLTLVYGTNQLVIKYHFFGKDTQIDQFVFADGTRWTFDDKAIAHKLAAIKGSAGNDKIMGAFDWNEIIDGLAGNDQINGAVGKDTLRGGAGNDLLAGGEGNDNLQGGTGNDELYGEQGDDSLSGGTGNDLLIGDEGRDTLKGESGNDKIYSGNSNDTLIGGAGNDYLDGGIDNDSLTGGSGKDTLVGGEGDDSYYITDLQDTVYDAAGNDTVYVSVDDYKVPNSIETIVLAKHVRPLPYFINNLLNGGAQLGINQAQIITYSFVFAQQSTLKNFAAYTPAQQSAAREALAKYSAVANITFIEKPDSTDVKMRFYRDDLSSIGFQDSAGYGSYPPESDIHINVKTQDMSLASGKLNGHFGTLLHEIGHTLGLKHLFEKPILGGIEDSTDNTVMSYQFGKYYAVDLGLFDKATIHYLFGVNPSVRLGNTQYAVTEHYIWDGAGTDTINASKQTLAVTIDLKPGSWNYVGAKAASILAKNQFFIGHGTLIENAIGGSANDTLTGNALANILSGGKGNDRLSGNNGNDKLMAGEGTDVLIGGLGKDSYVLTEATAAQDTVIVALGDSTLAHRDQIIDFKLTQTAALNSVDKLDLPSTHIAEDVAKVTGNHTGVLKSHHISHGLISFDDSNTYTSALTITQSNFTDALHYVQANIHSVGNSVVFNALGNSYVFQDGAIDTLIELTGITSSGLTHTGLLAGAILIA